MPLISGCRRVSASFAISSRSEEKTPGFIRKCTPLNDGRSFAVVVRDAHTGCELISFCGARLNKGDHECTVSSPMGAAFLVTCAVTFAMLATACPHAEAQNRSSHAPSQAVSGAGGDAVVDGLKFHPVGGFIQVVDVVKSQSAGTVILPPNQPPVFAAMPGYDARIKTAYEKYSHGSASDPAAPAETGQTSATPAPAAAVGFDAASKTVTLSDGTIVTFVDNDDLKVQMVGAAGAKTYDLHFHKAGAGGFMKEWAGREQGRVGGSLGGGGVTIRLEAQNGMPGGEVYDTAKGTVYGNSGFVQAKAVTAAVREASDVAETTQPDLAKLNVVKSLLSNNLGI